MSGRYKTTGQFFMNEVAINFNMFGVFMKNHILSNV